VIDPDEPVKLISIGCPSLAARHRFDELLARTQKEREAAELTSSQPITVEIPQVQPLTIE
jgi:hypothetical protein